MMKKQTTHLKWAEDLNRHINKVTNITDIYVKDADTVLLEK